MRKRIHGEKILYYEIIKHGMFRFDVLCFFIPVSNEPGRRARTDIDDCCDDSILRILRRYKINARILRRYKINARSLWRCNINVRCLWWVN